MWPKLTTLTLLLSIIKILYIVTTSQVNNIFDIDNSVVLCVWPYGKLIVHFTLFIHNSIYLYIFHKKNVELKL